MRSLLMITTSRRQKDVLRRCVPEVGLIHRRLFPAQLSQICCQSSEINLLTRCKNSEAGSFIGITESERAAFAAVSRLVGLRTTDHSGNYSAGFIKRSGNRSACIRNISRRKIYNDAKG